MDDYRLKPKLGRLTVPWTKAPMPELGRALLIIDPEAGELLRQAAEHAIRAAGAAKVALDHFVEYVVAKAREQGITVTPTTVSCGRATCGLCLGFLELHYPYFRVYEEGGRQRLVRSKELKDFLRRFLTEVELARFMRLMEFRDFLLQTAHNIERALRGVGLE
jgi:hypothetical protein